MTKLYTDLEGYHFERDILRMSASNRRLSLTRNNLNIHPQDNNKIPVAEELRLDIPQNPKIIVLKKIIESSEIFETDKEFLQIVIVGVLAEKNAKIEQEKFKLESEKTMIEFEKTKLEQLKKEIELTNARCKLSPAQVTARTIRRRLQQSGLYARRPLPGLPLTQNHRRLRRKWCDERRMWAAEWNEVVFTEESRICLQHHDGRIRVWGHRRERMLNKCVIHHHTGLAPGIMVWVGIGYHSRTPLVRIAGTLNSQRYISEVLEPVVLPYLQGLATATFQQANA
ncbi:transposable element Tcb1 transposase [Trichonephila clavipes]|nr:transposable element Tcb1 transposase [Trichonephila clavipes]